VDVDEDYENKGFIGGSHVFFEDDSKEENMSRIIESSIRSAIKRRGVNNKSRLSSSHKNILLGSILHEISDEEIHV